MKSLLESSESDSESSWYSIDDFAGTRESFNIGREKPSSLSFKFLEDFMNYFSVMFFDSV